MQIWKYDLVKGNVNKQIQREYQYVNLFLYLMRFIIVHLLIIDHIILYPRDFALYIIPPLNFCKKAYIMETPHYCYPCAMNVVDTQCGFTFNHEPVVLSQELVQLLPEYEYPQLLNVFLVQSLTGI